MLICCPYCNTKNEIEHVERGHHVVCTCGKKFTLDERSVLSDYSGIDKPPPSHIGPYPVERFIGRGGMGCVYKGVHPQLNLPVAIKTLLPEYAANAEFKERFIKSAKISAKLQHPNVVRIYDSSTDSNGFSYLVLEYVDGGTLYDEMQKTGPLSPKRTAEVGCAVCCALTEAKRFGIVHRDIKPDNIMLTKEGVCKLSDLGLAKIDLHREDLRAQVNYHSDTAIGQTGLGTPEYTAPEQSLDAKHCDIRADIYSLGVTMYELVTGQLPFPTHDRRELLQRHLEEKPRAPHELREDLPSMLEYIILKALLKDPAERYQSPEEMRADLEAFLHDVPLPSLAPAESENINLSDTQSEPTQTGETQSAAAVSDVADRTRRRFLIVILIVLLLLWVILLITGQLPD